MKICYIADGLSVHNHFMVDWFKERGHEILFLTDTADEAPSSCEVVEVAPRKGGGPLRHLKASYRARKEIALWKPDLVHAHNVTGYGYWGWLSGFKPLIVTAWGSDLYLLAQKNFLIYQLIKRTLKQAYFITADSSRLCQVAREIAGDQADIRSLQWGVNLNAFTTDVDPDLRKRFRGDASFVFISTRRLRPLYNIDVIINAFCKALPLMPNSRLVIVGEDHQRKALQLQVEQLKIEQHVSFTGWLERHELIAAMLCADAFVSVPSSDSTALSLLEAFASRLFVITSDLPDNREWITPGKNGCLVAPGQETPLVDAMIDLFENHPTRHSWCNENIEIVKERGNRDKEMARLEQWYQDLIEL